MADTVPWHARIFPSNGEEPVGAGIYVGEQKIVTCAHVIGAALDLADISSQPTGRVRVDFPQSAGRQVCWAQVIDKAWFPKRDEAGDLALLEIIGEDVTPATPAPLRLVGSPARRTIEVLGHPTGQRNGVWARARLIGRGGPNVEWIQMDTPTLTGKRIQRGFSGAGVIDEEDGTVIGCVVAVDTAVEDRVAWMIPTDVIIKYWSELRSLCVPALAATGPPRARGRLKTSPLSDPEWDRLAALLLAHSGIRGREDRLLHVKALERQFDGRIHIAQNDIARSEDGFAAALAIVSACAAHPGALHCLAEQLARYQPPEDASVFPAIAAAIEAVDPSPLLIPGERNQLYRLLNAIDPHVRANMVIRSYEEAVPPFGQAEIDPLDLPSVARELESATAVWGDLPPLIHFIEALCRQLPAANATDLHGWVDDYGRRVDLDRGQIARLRLSSPPMLTPSAVGYLVTEVVPYGADSEHYLPRITLQRTARSGQLTQGLLLYPPEDQMDDPVPWSKIPELFDSALSRVWASPAIPGDLVVEFLLPFPLLSEPVDQWGIEISGPAHVVGIDHVVVVRIWDRVADQRTLNRSMPYWQDKSARLNSPGTAVLWADPDDRQYITGRLYVDLFPDGEPCLGLIRPPSLPTAPGNDAVSIGIRTGVPAMIWCRDETISGPFVSLIDRYLAEHGLPELPRFILQLRRESVRTGEPVGANITLVWDLADRPAPAAQHSRSAS